MEIEQYREMARRAAFPPKLSTKAKASVKRAKTAIKTGKVYSTKTRKGKKRKSKLKIAKAGISIDPIIPAMAGTTLNLGRVPKPITDLAAVGVASMAPKTTAWQKALQALDVIVPEELLGLDLTPRTHGVGGKTQRQYSCILQGGKVIDLNTGRVIGYSPWGAKKKYKKKSRRKRWSKADERKMQWQAYIAAVANGTAAIPPPPL